MLKVKYFWNSRAWMHDPIKIMMEHQVMWDSHKSAIALKLIVCILLPQDKQKFSCMSEAFTTEEISGCWASSSVENGCPEL